MIRWWLSFRMGVALKPGESVPSSKARSDHNWPVATLPINTLHLQQVFRNLIGNAIKYRSPERTPTVHTGAERQNAHWIFLVADNGIGIDPEYRENILVFSSVCTIAMNTRNGHLSTNSGSVSFGGLGSNPNPDEDQSSASHPKSYGFVSTVDFVAPRHGFEPRLTAPKAAVLPLDDRGTRAGEGLRRIFSLASAHHSP
jgi:hypothetical protein